MNRSSGSRPTSSANRQKSSRIRKCAASCGSAPYRRRSSASRANWLAASSVTWRGSARGASVRVGENRAQHAPAVGGQQVVQRQPMDAFDGVGEVGVDDDALHVADDQQGRVLAATSRYWRSCR